MKTKVPICTCISTVIECQVSSW